MAKGAKLAANTPVIEQFKTQRNCYNDNGIFWTTYCKVKYQVGGQVLNETLEIKLIYKQGVCKKVELVEGTRINKDTVGSNIFSTSLASFAYEGDSLLIRGNNKLGYYEVSIGQYAKEFVDKYLS